MSEVLARCWLEATKRAIACLFVMLKYQETDPGLHGNGMAHAVPLISEGGVSATSATCSYQRLVDQEKCLH